MSTQPSDPDRREAEEIERDRDSFLEAVRPIVGDQELQEYTQVVDKLIAWSRTRRDLIELKPRDGAQDIVRFCLVGTPRVFWAVYPRRTQSDAKLVALQDDVPEIPRAARDLVQKRFIELSRFAPESSQDVPTLSLRLLKHPATFEQVIAYLEEALSAIQAGC